MQTCFVLAHAWLLLVLVWVCVCRVQCGLMHHLCSSSPELKAPSSCPVPPDAPQRRGVQGLWWSVHVTTLMRSAGHCAGLASLKATFDMLGQARGCELILHVPGLLQPAPSPHSCLTTDGVSNRSQECPWPAAIFPSSNHSSPSLPSPFQSQITAASGLSITGRNPTGSQHCSPHCTEPAAWPEGACSISAGLPPGAKQPGA